jgi:ribose/xylose/arabinose/galactoside ABC-type transport system permease subunit
MLDALRRLGRRVILFFLGNSIVIVFIVLCVVMGFASNKFFTTRNWMNILANFSVTGIVSIGVAIVMIAGGLDLSFGPILGSCAILATLFQPNSFALAILLPIVLGAALGSVNGLVIARAGTNPLVTTLGTQWLFYSALMIITDGHLVQGNQKTFFKEIGYGRVLGVPFPPILMVIVCILAWFILRHTLFGKYVYAHGSRQRALSYAGVNTKNVYLFAYLVMGIIIGIGGVLFSSREIGVRPTEGSTYLIPVLTAVILSGVSLSGGIGSVFNVMIAALTLGVLDNAMVLLAVDYKNQLMVRGIIFILAVIYNGLMVMQRDFYLTRLSQRR